MEARCWVCWRYAGYDFLWGYLDSSVKRNSWGKITGCIVSNSSLIVSFPPLCWAEQFYWYFLTYCYLQRHVPINVNLTSTRWMHPWCHDPEGHWNVQTSCSRHWGSSEGPVHSQGHGMQGESSLRIRYLFFFFFDNWKHIELLIILRKY